MKKILSIHLEDIVDKTTLHDALSKQCSFPDYYGKNWDAFDECIRDMDPPDAIEVYGLGHLQDILPRDAKILNRVIGDFAKEIGAEYRIC